MHVSLPFSTSVSLHIYIYLKVKDKTTSRRDATQYAFKSLFKNKQLIKKGKIQEKCISSNELVQERGPRVESRYPLRAEPPRRPLIVYKDYFFNLNKK